MLAGASSVSSFVWQLALNRLAGCIRPTAVGNMLRKSVDYDMSVRLHVGIEDSDRASVLQVFLITGPLMSTVIPSFPSCCPLPASWA